MPRYMSQVRATAMSEAGDFPDDPTLVPRMMAFHDEMAAAGVLLDGAGLQASSRGWRIHYSAGDRRTVTDGPFAESKELIAGYTLIQVRSREEALEWSRRFPNPVGEGMEADIEVRQLYELEDFGETEQTRRFRDLGMG